MKRPIVGVIIFFVIFLRAGAYAEEESVLITIERLRPAMVLVKADMVAKFSGEDKVVRQAFASRSEMTPRRGIAKYTRTGSGIVLDSSGIIVTNLHTVNRANRITVTTSDGREYTAKVLSIVSAHDLVFLKIDGASPMVFMPIARADMLVPGLNVFTVGGSELLKGTISEGVITGIGNKKEPDDEAEEQDVLRITFGLFKGDSGSPVMTRDGSLAGIIVAGAPQGGHLSIATAASRIEKYYKKAIAVINR